MFVVAVLPTATHAQDDQQTSPPPVDVSKVQVIKMGADTVYFTQEELGETADSTSKAGGKRRINYNDPKGAKGFGYQYMIYTYPSVTSDGTGNTLSDNKTAIEAGTFFHVTKTTYSAPMRAVLWLGGEPTQKGIYIHNGRKVIVR